MSGLKYTTGMSVCLSVLSVFCLFLPSPLLSYYQILVYITTYGILARCWGSELRVLKFMRQILYPQSHLPKPSFSILFAECPGWDIRRNVWGKGGERTEVLWGAGYLSGEPSKDKAVSSPEATSWTVLWVSKFGLRCCSAGSNLA